LILSSLRELTNVMICHSSDKSILSRRFSINGLLYS
jgi:hypothetical protein